MSEARVQQRPKAENGLLFVGPWGEVQEALVRARWPELEVEQLGEALTRVDLSRTPRGACPGFNDVELLSVLSQTVPGALVVGFFCDAVEGVEGARVFERGRQRDLKRTAWEGAHPPDPIAWPIGSVAVSLQLPVEAVTRVDRPPRPALTVAAEALLAGEPVAEPALLHRALQVLGLVEHPEATAALVRHLTNEDWVARFHAVRSYARLVRGQGTEGRPRLEALMADPDEGVRESLLRGVGELVQAVEFGQLELHRQIDAAIRRGLSDEDEDVRAAAEEARGLRERLLG